MGTNPFMEYGHLDIERLLEEEALHEKIRKRVEFGMPEMSIRSREDADKVFEFRNKWNLLQRNLCEAMADEAIVCRENSCYGGLDKKRAIERRETIETEIKELEKEMEEYER